MRRRERSAAPGIRNTAHRRGRIRSGLRASVRLQEIAVVLVKYSLSDWLRLLHLDKVAPGVRAVLTRPGHTVVPPGSSRWKLLRMAIEELGPTFVKLGQLLSNRTDLLPPELIAELSALQDASKPLPWEEISTTLTRELGCETSEVFTELDETPAASASIAQVHRGVLRGGREVAVKVQRPDIRKTIETDLEIMALLAKLAERHISTTRYLAPCDLVTEFRRSLMRELDFTREAANLSRFRITYGDRRGLHVPAVHQDHSTEHLLVMDYVHGVKISELGPDREGSSSALPDYNPAAVARRGADILLEQVLVHGFFHADPHPGNLMVLPGNVICFLDFGSVGRLSEHDRRYLASAILAVVGRDGARATEALLRLTRSNKTTGIHELTEEVQDMVDDYLDRPLSDINVTTLFSQIITLMVGHGIRMPASLLLVTRALMTMEGVGMNIWPEFTLQPALEKVTRRIIMNRLKPEKLAREGGRLALDYVELMQDVPGDAADIIRQLRSGHLTVGMRLRGLEPLRHAVDAVGYRLIYGIVLAAVMMSSALIVHAAVPPLWNGVSIIGIAGFGIAGILSLGFLFSLIARVFRHERKR